MGCCDAQPPGRTKEKPHIPVGLRDESIFAPDDCRGHTDRFALLSDILELEKTLIALAKKHLRDATKAK